jgi:hypothetical protein
LTTEEIHQIDEETAFISIKFGYRASVGGETAK